MCGTFPKKNSISTSDRDFVHFGGISDSSGLPGILSDGPIVSTRVGRRKKRQKTESEIEEKGIKIRGR